MSESWTGIIYDSSLPEGQSKCVVQTDGSRFLAQTSEGKEYTFSIVESPMDWSGRGRKMLVVSPPKGKEPRLALEDQSILQVLKKKANSPRIQHKIERLEATAHKLKWMLGSFFAVLAAFVAFLYITFAYGPTLALEVIPYSVDKQLGEASFDASLQQITGGKVKEVKSKSVKKAVDTMMNRLVGAMEKNPYDFQVKIVHSEMTNAFALPGGKIAILTGLMKEAEGPEEVVGVLAHEICHVTCRHGVQSLVQRAGMYLIVSALVGDASELTEFIISRSAQLANLKFSRDMEREADRCGFKLLVQAKINPRGLQTFFKKMKEKHGDAPVSWISTHPLSEERIETIGQWVDELDNFEATPLDINWEAVKEDLKEEQKPKTSEKKKKK